MNTLIYDHHVAPLSDRKVGFIGLYNPIHLVRDKRCYCELVYNGDYCKGRRKTMDKNYIHWRDLRTGEISTVVDTILEESAKEKGRQLRSKERQEILKRLTPDAQYAITMSMFRKQGLHITSKDDMYQDYCQFCQKQDINPDTRSDFDAKVPQRAN